MKKLLLLLLIPTFCFSQIKKVEKSEPGVSIGKIENKKIMIAEIRKFEDGNYTFFYRNAEYKHLTDFKFFHFKDIDNAFNEFYNIISEGFNDMPEKPINLELGEFKIRLHFSKISRKKHRVMIFILNDKTSSSPHTHFLSEKNINVLFGKQN